MFGIVGTDEKSELDLLSRNPFRSSLADRLLALSARISEGAERFALTLFQGAAEKGDRPLRAALKSPGKV